VPQLKLAGPAEFVLPPQGGNPVPMPGPLSVTATPAGCRITDARNHSQDFLPLPIDILGVGEDSAASEASPALATRVKVDGVSFPGHIRLIPRGDGSR